MLAGSLCGGMPSSPYFPWWQVSELKAHKEASKRRLRETRKRASEAARAGAETI